MIKFVVAALWISAATVGAVFYSFQNSGKADDAQPAPAMFGGLDYVKTDLITVPIVRNSAVEGYFIARLVFTAEPARLNRLSVPPSALFADQVYSYLYSNPQFDMSDRTAVNLDGFRSGIRDSINRRVGDKLIHEVLIEQMDFLTRDDIRDHSRRRRKPAAQTGPTSEMTADMP